MAHTNSAPDIDSQVPLVSFVTPFYNTEQYLEECIESVLRQTYGNWEYVLLNNCSTDKSVQIAERYARQYPDRIRLEHNSEFLAGTELQSRFPLRLFGKSVLQVRPSRRLALSGMRQKYGESR